MTLSVEQAARLLTRGEVVVVPTDTVYGLAARPTDVGAVARVFSLKGRPESKPLPVLGAGVAQLEAVVSFDERARRLIAEFWPGPLTIVLPRAAGFDVDLGGTERETVAVRVPARDVCLELLAATGPLAVTSANRSGEAPATDPVAARAVFPAVEVLDDGDCRAEPSTVVALIHDPVILRRGPLDEAVLRALS